MNNNNIEIERKWLINNFPDEFLKCKEESLIKQGYISCAPAVRIREHIKENSTEYVLCFKGKGTLCRKEFEMNIKKEEFDELCSFLLGELVTKEFKTYELETGEILEVSLVDKGKSTSFFYAEVEFESELKANDFCPPHFLGEEKTNDETFSMSNYWKKTREIKA